MYVYCYQLGGWINNNNSSNAVSMLAHRLRLWHNIKTALGECLVFAGIQVSYSLSHSLNKHTYNASTSSIYWHVYVIGLTQFNFTLGSIMISNVEYFIEQLLKNCFYNYVRKSFSVASYAFHFSCIWIVLNCIKLGLCTSYRLIILF